MSIQNITKYAFADALKKLLTKKELSKVYVKDICNLCGAERSTFYYHFKDKYELVSWIYEQAFQDALELADNHYNVVFLEHLLIAVKTEQKFYQKVFEDISQNTLSKYIYEVSLKIFAKILKKKWALSTITQEQEIIMNFYVYAWIGVLHDWVSEKYDISAKSYAVLLYQAIQHLDISDIEVAELEYV